MDSQFEGEVANLLEPSNVDFKLAEFDTTRDLILAAEREQLISTWQKVARKDLLAHPSLYAQRLCSENQDKMDEIWFRKWHDQLGWKAWDDLKNKGLCSGAIYRTERFMLVKQSERNGSKGPNRTVHIEHTMPINVLFKAWKNVRASNENIRLEDAYAWMLVHSVTTAFHDEEEKLPISNKDNFAMEATSRVFDRPFMRYAGAEGLDGSVWNVLTGEKVDFATWSFASHFQSIISLMRSAGFAGETEQKIFRSATDYLKRYKQSEAG